jgi:hypothetical protein
MTKDMEEKAIRHAMTAVSHAKMKSLDPNLSGIAFIAEGLKLIFPIDSGAYALAGNCVRHAGGILMVRNIDDARQKGATEAEIATLERMVAADTKGGAA